MVREMIVRHNYLVLQRRTYSFNMTNHINRWQVNAALTDICVTIDRGFQAELPMWARLQGGHRIFPIPPDHSLFQYLDEDSRRKVINWLIFNKTVAHHNKVTHFGPFGKKKDEKFDETVKVVDRALEILKEQLNALKAPESKMTEKQIKEERDRIIEEIQTKYWAAVQDIESKIESKKAECKSFILRVCDGQEVNEEISELTDKLMASAGKVVTKKITKKLTVQVVKEIARKATVQIGAKMAAKEAGKVAGKTAAKKIPVVGAVFGVGFGLWRLVQGDVVGAGMEVASGAASCVPGGGTAVSFGIDAAIVAKDIAEARAEINRHAEELKAEMKKFDMELNDLAEQCDNAKEAYEFAKEVSEDFQAEKLQREIAILRDISKAFHQA